MVPTANNVKLLRKDVSVPHACTVENAKTSVLVLTAHVLWTTLESVANTSSMHVKLVSVRTEPLVWMRAKVTPVNAPQASKERTVMKILLTAKTTLAHLLQHALIYQAASTANVHSI